MKKHEIICSILLISLLESCSIKDFFNKESVSDNESISESETISESSSIKESETSINEDKFINIYSLNDFHGAINETSSEPGLEKIFNYLNAKGKEENSLIVNSGDMFQGSIESNSNYGNLIMDAMNYVHMDAMTLGNHEFDWGIEYINKNIERKGNDGYQTPIITSNLYNYNMATKEELDYANVGPTYSISTLENGLKVGFIGVIGSHQITSISSQFVDNYSFSNPIPIIKEISDDLRINKGVDVVILLDHDGQSSITQASTYDKAGITLKSVESNKRYVDAVICGHTHKNEKRIINGVPFIQTSGYGKQIGNIKLKVSSTNNISCISYTSLTPDYSSYKGIDNNLSNLIKSYTEKSDILANEKLATLTGSLYSSSTLPNLVCKAMFDYASSKDFDIDYAICNNVRYSLYDGDITYGDLYRCLPFDNQVYVLDVKGNELIDELSYCMMYRNNKNPIEANKTYRIACIDYLAFHRNDNRDYDYFASNVVIDSLKDNDENTLNYRDITTWYLKLNKNINSNDYDDYLSRYDTSLIYQKI